MSGYMEGTNKVRRIERVVYVSKVRGRGGKECGGWMDGVREPVVEEGESIEECWSLCKDSVE